MLTRKLITKTINPVPTIHHHQQHLIPFTCNDYRLFVFSCSSFAFTVKCALRKSKLHSVHLFDLFILKLLCLSWSQEDERQHVFHIIKQWSKCMHTLHSPHLLDMHLTCPHFCNIQYNMYRMFKVTRWLPPQSLAQPAVSPLNAPASVTDTVQVQQQQQQQQ